MFWWHLQQALEGLPEGLWIIYKEVIIILQVVGEALHIYWLKKTNQNSNNNNSKQRKNLQTFTLQFQAKSTSVSVEVKQHFFINTEKHCVIWK